MKPEFDLRAKIQGCLGKEITQFVLKGKGACNNAYYIETVDGGKYIVKQEREQKESEPQNTLLIEAAIAKHLHNLGLSIPIPHVVFVSEHPITYGYEYIDGEMMIGVWDSLSEDERIGICQNLGHFHAEIGKKVDKETSQKIGIKIDEFQGLHPEVLKEYHELTKSDDVPDHFKSLAETAMGIFNETLDRSIFQFIHNDAHHENVLIKNRKISGIIDFGNTEYGEVTKEFSRYIRDFPEYFTYIVSAYEKESGHQLSYKHLVSNALLSGFVDIIEEYRKGGNSREKAVSMITTYQKLLTSQDI